ncbi:hypothetical protein Lalb_Chr03g0030871 [Lupinus albus]|uniref:Uncharacterized protein n=1 Tax=Lupinus albus TaxID=3870 RepID=A0A6A4QVV6_LUPAL|nr:hypothetical protein Lalb_Chr03g0030871 [Lupinus albus]
MQGCLSAWLVKHGLIHRSLGFDYQGIETLQRVWSKIHNRVRPQRTNSLSSCIRILVIQYKRLKKRFSVLVIQLQKRPHRLSLSRLSKIAVMVKS